MRSLNALLLSATIIALGSSQQPSRGEERAPAVELSSEQSTVNRRLNEEIYELQTLVEEALVWRVKASGFFHYLEGKSGENLSSADLARLYAGAESYLAMRERLFAHVAGHEHLYADNVAIPYGAADGQLLMKKVKIALAAGLTLYDNYIVGVYPYFADGKIRRLLRTDRPALEGKLRELTLSYLSLANRQKAAFGISAFLAEQESASYRALDRETAYLDSLVRQSPAFHYLKERGYRVAGGSVASFTRLIVDDLNQLSRISTFATSMLFGNAIGLIETRKGHLIGLAEAEKRSLADSLEPLDVLLEKTPFRLTDKFIPGHYGHVAIWVGNETRLRELGVWDHPAVVPHQATVRKGRHVVEALRPGVQINRLEHFLNIDDLLVLRHTSLAPEQRRRFVINAFRQIGKEYDFNFDVETDKRIVCSEIAYVVFQDVQWPTMKQLGRYTISPDNVAVRGLNRNPFTPVTIYHDGMRIGDRLEETLDALLKADYRKVRRMHAGAFRRPEDEGGSILTPPPQ